MNVTVEKNVPIPPSRKERTAGTAIRLDDMEPGDSKLFSKQRRGSLSTAMRMQKFTSPGTEFTTRVVDDGKNVRVWRIK